MENKCPFCGAYWDRTKECYANQLAALKAELAAFRETFEEINSDCHELIKQNRTLKTQVQRSLIILTKISEEVRATDLLLAGVNPADIEALLPELEKVGME